MENKFANVEIKERTWERHEPPQSHYYEDGTLELTEIGIMGGRLAIRYFFVDDIFYSSDKDYSDEEIVVSDSFQREDLTLKDFVSNPQLGWKYLEVEVETPLFEEFLENATKEVEALKNELLNAKLAELSKKKTIPFFKNVEEIVEFFETC